MSLKKTMPKKKAKIFFQMVVGFMVMNPMGSQSVKESPTKQIQANEAVLGMGIPLHKPYPYSLCNLCMWGVLHF